MIFNLGNGGGSNCTVRYNQKSGFLEVLVDGNWEKTSLEVSTSSDGILYDNGSFNVGFDSGTSEWSWSTTRTLENSVTAENSIIQTSSTVNKMTLIGTTDKIDVTDFENMTVKFTNNNTDYTLVLDLSGVTGSYYLGVVTYVGITSTAIGLFASSSKTDADTHKIAWVSQDGFTTKTNQIKSIYLI